MLDEVNERIKQIINDHRFNEKLKTQGYLYADEVWSVVAKELGFDFDYTFNSDLTNLTYKETEL